jgi:hypothetical protein
MQRLASRSDASARCLVCANAAHHEPSPTLAVKRVSLFSRPPLSLFCLGQFHAHNIVVAGYPEIFPRVFLFFLGGFGSNSGKRMQRRAYRVFTRGPRCGEDPIARSRPQRAEPDDLLASSEAALSLTTFRRNSELATRELSQNGIWIRITSDYGILFATPKSVPTHPLTIQSRSSGIRGWPLGTKAMVECGPSQQFGCRRSTRAKRANDFSD